MYVPTHSAVPPNLSSVSAQTRLVRFLFRIHRWSGLLAGVPLAIILFTGTLAVFKDEIDQVLNPHLLLVQPTLHRSSLQAAYQLARTTNIRIDIIELPSRHDRAVSFYGYTPDGTWQQITIDPYRLHILGNRDVRSSFADILRQLHVRFYFFGPTGRIVVGLFGLALATSGITGLLLYPRFIRAHPWRCIRWRRGPQWLWSDLHKLFGLVSFACNLLWAVTGMVLGLENLGAYWKPVQRAFHPTPTVRATTFELLTPLDSFIHHAQRIMPELHPRRISLPSRLGAPIILYGTSQGSWTGESSSWIAFEPADGRVLQLHRHQDAPLLTRMYNYLDPLHFGSFAGLSSQILWFFFGVLVSLLPVTGLFLWFNKKKFRLGH
jgi:uncharacterized iron-regulated membrane protein